MSEPALQIDRLTLRVPGLGAEEGRRLGLAVAERLRDLDPSAAGIHELGRLTIRVEGGAGRGIERLAEQIARAIYRGIQ